MHQSVIFHCKQQEQEAGERERPPVDTEPRVGATHVPSNSLLLTEQICGYLQITEKKGF